MIDKILSLKIKLSLLIGLLACSSFIYAAPTQTPLHFPPSLMDTSKTAVLSSNIKTPEYVIVRANEETTFSSETSGKVIQLPLKEGSIFQAGDLLLELDCRLQAADLKKAKAAQEATSKAYQSAKKLKAFGTISEFESVKAAAEAEAADADVDKLQTIVEKCKILAPFSGSVAEIEIHLYEIVKPGDPLIKVVNTDNLFVELQVPSNWLSWLHIGTSFNVYINDIHQTIFAKVTLINPEIDPISQTVKITGQVSPREPKLRPGMTGQAIFNDNPEKE